MDIIENIMSNEQLSQALDTLSNALITINTSPNTINNTVATSMNTMNTTVATIGSALDLMKVVKLSIWIHINISLTMTNV